MASPVYHSKINTGLQFRQTLAAGPYAWPGGYPLYLLADDGEAFCFTCARKNGPGILRAIRDRSSDGWRVVACGINEDTDMQCVQCSESIPAACAD